MLLQNVMRSSDVPLQMHTDALILLERGEKAYSWFQSGLKVCVMTRVLTQLSASLASTYLQATLRCFADYQAELQIMLQSAASGV